MRREVWRAPKICLLCLTAVAGAAFALPGLASAQGSGYRLANTVKLGGEGGWDYLLADPATHRVFISRGTHTMVVDADGKLIGDIPRRKASTALRSRLNSNAASRAMARPTRSRSSISILCKPSAKLK